MDRDRRFGRYRRTGARRPLGSVLIAAALTCPLAMYVGMRGMGMGQDCRQEGMHEHREDGLPEKSARVSQGEPHGR
jgi:hypothetical protein